MSDKIKFKLNDKTRPVWETALAAANADCCGICGICGDACGGAAQRERTRVLELMAVAKVEHDGLRPFTAFKELENAIRSGETAAELEKRLRGEG